MALPLASSQVVGDRATEGAFTYEVVSVGGINVWNKVDVVEAGVSGAAADVETSITGDAIITDNVDVQAALLEVSAAIVNEVIESAGALAGASPAGAQWGVDTTTGQAYYVNGGNWAAVPTASVDLNINVTDQTGGNGTGTLVPVAPATATPDVGDVEQDIYDDVVLYFTAVAANWTAPAVIEVPRNVIDLATAVSPASDDATGLVGVSTLVAKQDHKHPAQGVSVDAEQLLKDGTDGLAMLDPDDLVSADADNQIIKGTDAKLHVPAAALERGGLLYSDTAAYSVGDVVQYDSRLYFAIAARAVGVWTATPIAAQFEKLPGIVQGVFDDSLDYVVGDIVYDDASQIGNENGIYRVDVAHTGGNAPAKANFTEICARRIFRGEHGADYYKVGDVILEGGNFYRCITGYDNISFTGPFFIFRANWEDAAVAGLHYIVEDAVDFTTAEPAHVADAIYKTTVAGVGSTTTGTTFTVENLYKSNGTTWTEIVPVEGMTSYDKTADAFSVFDGAAWAASSVDNIYTADGTLAGNRVVSLNGNTLTLDGATASQDITFDDGAIISLGNTHKQVSGTASLSITPDVSEHKNRGYNITNGTVGNLTLNGATGALSGPQNYVLTFTNGDVIDRTIDFNTGDYQTLQGNDPSSITLAAGDVIQLAFVGGQTGVVSTLVTGGVENLATNDLQLDGSDRTFDLNGQEFFISDSTSPGRLGVYILDSTLNAESLTRVSQAQVDSSPFTPDPRSNDNITIATTAGSTGDFIINAPSGGSFALGNTFTVSLQNFDTISRNFVFNSEFKDNAGNDIGTVTLAAGEKIQIKWSKTESNVYRRIDFDGQAPTQTAVLLDSSAGVDAQSLAAATGSGNIVWFANSDVQSNDATIAPASGESINGLTADALFYASNYADNTTFKATDVATGLWSVEVVGAPTSTYLDVVRFGYDMTASGGLNTTEADEPILEAVASTGVTHLDANSNLDLATGAYTAPHDMKVRVDVQVGYMNNTSTGTNAVANQRRLAYSIDGATPVVGSSAPINPEWLTSTNDYSIAAGTVVLDLLAGEVLTLFWSQPGAESNVQTITFNDVTIQQLPSQETVLAGHVVPTDLDFIQVELSADATTVADGSAFRAVLDTVSNPGAGSLALNADGTVTLLAGRKYKVDGYSYTATIANASLYDFTNDTNLSPWLAGGITESAGSLTTIVSPTADINVGLGYATAETVQGNTGISGRASMLIQELPTSSLVNPSSVPVEDLHHSAGFMADESTTQNINVTANTPMDLADAQWNFFDEQSLIDTANDKVVITQDGVYEVQIGTASSTTANQYLSIRLNGVVVATSREYDTGATGQNLTTMWLGNLVASDEITFTSSVSNTLVNPWFKVSQKSAKTITALDPAFTEAKDLARGRLEATVDSGAVTAGSPVGFDRVATYGNMTGSGTTGLIATNTGAYRGEFYMTPLDTSVASNNAFAIFLDGVQATDFIATDLGGAGQPANHANISFKFDATAGQVITVQPENTEASGYTFIGEGDVKMYFDVEQLPSTEYVTPGDVPVEDLHRVQFNVSSGANVAVVGGYLDLDDTALVKDDAQSLLGASDDIIISQAGVYDISYSAASGSADIQFSIEVEGSVVATGKTGGAAGNIGHTAQWSGSLAVGDVIKFTSDQASMRYVSIKVLQIASKTITYVDPAFTVAEDLHYVSMHLGQHNYEVSSVGGGYAVPDLDNGAITTTYDPNGIINTTANTFDIQNDGVYEVIYNYGDDSARDALIRVDGVEICRARGAQTGPVVAIVSLVAGQQIEVGVAGSTLQVTDTTLSVKQLQKTVIANPATIVLDTFLADTTTAYATVSADNQKIVTLDNASAVTVTVDDSMLVGESMTFIQKGAGVVGFAASGVTINSLGGALNLAGQYASATLVKEAAGVYYLIGNIA